MTHGNIKQPNTFHLSLETLGLQKELSIASITKLSVNQYYVLGFIIFTMLYFVEGHLID